MARLTGLAKILAGATGGVAGIQEMLFAQKLREQMMQSQQDFTTQRDTDQFNRELQLRQLVSDLIGDRQEEQFEREQDAPLSEAERRRERMRLRGQRRDRNQDIRAEARRLGVDDSGPIKEVRKRIVAKVQQLESEAKAAGPEGSGGESALDAKRNQERLMQLANFYAKAETARINQELKIITEKGFQNQQDKQRIAQLLQEMTKVAETAMRKAEEELGIRFDRSQLGEVRIQAPEVHGLDEGPATDRDLDELLAKQRAESGGTSQ